MVLLFPGMVSVKLV